MKCYADSSFIVQLLLQDFATAEARDCHRALGRPPLIYDALHALEVPNSLYLRIHAAAGTGSRLRAATKRETQTGLRRLQHMQDCGQLFPVQVDMNSVLAEAASLAECHTSVTGARSLDTLHVAAALILEADKFLTCDKRQAKLARRLGLEVKLIGATHG